LLLRRQLRHAARFVLIQRREDAAVRGAEIGMTHVRGFDDAVEAEDDAAELSCGHVAGIVAIPALRRKFLDRKFCGARTARSRNHS